MTDLTWQINQHGGSTVVALTGELTLANAAPVRGVLLKCLAESPPAVVVDVSGMRVRDDHALLVFPAVLRHASRWPPVPLVLCCACRELTQQLQRLRIPRQLRCLPTLEEALEVAAARQALADRVVVTLLATPQAPSQGRTVLSEACRCWGLTEVTRVAEVIVSEFCANAVRHARTSMRVILTRTDTHLHVVVRDGDPTLPRQRAAPEEIDSDSSGWGLNLVDRFATTWGAMRTVDGKAVWASLRLPEQ